MNGSTKVAAAALALVIGAGCGGGSKKINYAKYDATKKVAIVGVCQLTDVVVARGTETGSGNIGNNLIEPLAANFDKALPAAWKGVEVVPLAAVAANESLTRHEPFKRRVCAHAFDPFQPKGYTGDADKTYMAGLANKLGVDAVIAITANVGLRFSSDKVRAYAGSFNPLYVHMVDKNGEQIVWMSMKGLDSVDVPVTNNDAATYAALGASYAGVIADEFVKRVSDR